VLRRLAAHPFAGSERGQDEEEARRPKIPPSGQFYVRNGTRWTSVVDSFTATFSFYIGGGMANVEAGVATAADGMAFVFATMQRGSTSDGSKP
jgi:hypothetical protein